MRSKFGRFILESTKRIPLLIGVYSGLEITGASVMEAVTNAKAQTKAVLAIHERFNSNVMLTAMDLSVEAELFGCQIKLSPEEIPTVIGRKLTSASDIDLLELPRIGEGRTAVHLETASSLAKYKRVDLPVIGGVIGPFSLAGCLFGVSETLELSLTDPAMLRSLLSKTTKFLSSYVNAFREQGADGVIIAEPAAGLLSPQGMGEFSSFYVKQIVDQNQRDDFSIILHNCGAKIAHLPKMMESCAEIYHFGAPMDIGKAIRSVESDIILAGNLDPTAIFHNGSTVEANDATKTLLKLVDGYKNFIPSSGCDIPPGSSVKNIEVFFKTVRSLNNASVHPVYNRLTLTFKEGIFGVFLLVPDGPGNTGYMIR